MSALELSIALDKACYFPGELLKCLVKVRCAPLDAAAAAAPAGTDELQQQQLQLHFECSGSERVDPSWVGRLHHPEVTAQKDNRRLVRSIFSTGQVPLLEGASDTTLAPGSSREFIVRCRLPARTPPSYRGNSVRFVYQAVARASLAPPAQQQQQQQQACQAHSSFVVWPMPDRTSLDRRTSLPSGPNAAAPGGSTAGTLPHAASGLSAASQDKQQQQPHASAPPPTAAAAAGGPDGLLSEVELIDYKLGQHVTRLRWEEVVVNADGSRTLLAHAPSAALYPAASIASQVSALTAAQLCALDTLQLDGGGPQQLALKRRAAAGAAAAAAAGDDDGDAGAGALLRHLTPAQRASMSPRTFNLRAGDSPLLRLVLQPPVDGLLQPGGTFGLLLDFRASHGAAAAAAASGTPSTQPVCLQVVALLETEELVLHPHAPARAAAAASGAPGVTTARHLHAEQQQLTAHLLTSHFTFSLPLTAPPSFRTPMVAHTWVLRFELTLGKPRKGRPGEMDTEQLLWALPLLVFPPLPASAGG